MVKGTCYRALLKVFSVSRICYLIFYFSELGTVLSTNLSPNCEIKVANRTHAREKGTKSTSQDITFCLQGQKMNKTNTNQILTIHEELL